jgi:ABC-type transport system involved in multi-copper enzyme maturation permease subunit
VSGTEAAAGSAPTGAGASTATGADARVSPGAFLSGVRIVARRELGAYFDSAIAYVYTIGFVVLANAVFMQEFFLTGTADMTSYFSRMPLLLAIFLPAVTMRLWAEERKQRTIELLLTLPIVPLQAVCGKFVAALGLYALFLVGSLPIVVMLVVLGDPDLGLIAAGYLGLLALGSLLLALGLFLSALSADQIVAFVGTAFFAFALVLLGNERVVAVLDGLAPKLAAGTLLAESISVAPPYETFVAGSVELSSVVFFGAFTAVFLWLCAHALLHKRA